MYVLWEGGGGVLHRMVNMCYGKGRGVCVWGGVCVCVLWEGAGCVCGGGGGGVGFITPKGKNKIKY